MGYLYLIIALLTGTIKGFCGKKTSGVISHVKDAMLANTVRMVMCILIGFGVILLKGELPLLKIGSDVFFITLLSGVSTSAFVVLWLLAVRKSAYMMLDVFLMLGTIIPITASHLLFSEKIKLTQGIGIAILIFAVFIMCSYNNSIKERIKPSSFLILILCGISSGVADFSQKLFVKTDGSAGSAVFNFYTYVFSSLILVLCYTMMVRRNENGKGDESFKKIKSVFSYIIVMSICLFLNSFFKVLAAQHLPAAQLYPIYQGLAMILSTVMSTVFFKEKLTLKCIVGIFIAFAGLIFINVI